MQQPLSDTHLKPQHYSDGQVMITTEHILVILQNTF